MVGSDLLAVDYNRIAGLELDLDAVGVAGLVDDRDLEQGEAEAAGGDGDGSRFAVQIVEGEFAGLCEQFAAIEQIHAEADALIHFPFKYQQYKHLDPTSNRIRSRVKWRYRLIYEIVEKERVVHLHRIYHTSRHPENIKRA